jgi:hypothetical protein
MTRFLLHRREILPIIWGGYFSSCASAAGQETLAADLYALITCEKSEAAKLVQDLETVLRSLNFRISYNLLHERNYPRFTALHEDAIIDLTRFPMTPDRYALALITKPPTHRQNSIEDLLLKLFNRSDNCLVTSEVRHHNDETKLRAFQMFWRILSR